MQIFLSEFLNILFLTSLFTGEVYGKSFKKFGLFDRHCDWHV